METAKRTFLEFYALAVCFINVLIGSIAVGFIVYSIVAAALPGFTLSGWEYSKYQSNDEFIASRPENSYDKFKNMSEQEITSKREIAYGIALKAEQRDATQSIVNFSIVLLIQIILFIVHWKLAKRKRLSG